MEREKNVQGHGECDLEATGHRLVEEGRRLQSEGHRLEEEGRRLFEEGRRLEAEGKCLEEDRCEEKEKDLFIFVNRIRFDERKGVKHLMTIDEIAGLVGLTSATATVRRLLCGEDTSDPLTEPQKIKRGDQFVVTRRAVEGGFQDRVEAELSRLRESSQVVEYASAPIPCVIYRKVPTKTRGTFVDVMVPVPNGYPASMIDRAALPEGSSAISNVKGSPQEVVRVAGQDWRMISYHPHAGGGGRPWDPSIHGFDTYLAEILAWLEVGK